jgi:hypothetical protein
LQQELLAFKRYYLYERKETILESEKVDSSSSPRANIVGKEVHWKDYDLKGMNDTQINSIVSIVQNGDRDFLYSLSVFNPLSDSIGVLIPITSNKIFLNFIKHVDFKQSRPIHYVKYRPTNLSNLMLNGETVLIKSQNELVELEITNNNFLSIGENWYSINQLSIYLLILLLFLFVGDVFLKFQVLK